MSYESVLLLYDAQNMEERRTKYCIDIYRLAKHAVLAYNFDSV